MIAPDNPAIDHEEIVNELLAETPDTIVASKLILKDATGKARAVIQATRTGATFALVDPDTKQMQVFLGTCGSDAGIGLYDAHGHERLSCSITGTMGDMYLLDPEGIPVFNVGF